MLIDEVQIKLKGGHGGPGRVSFNPGKKGGPSGGNGGKGGDVYITVTSDLAALNQFSKSKIKEAEDGQEGGIFKSSGKNGEDLEIKMPIGTELIDLRTEEKIELNDLNQRILICKGGLGGRGNFEFRSSTNTTPTYAQPGLKGQEREFKVELKFLADFGLIGKPNAGKSSLLNELTKAQVKVADYPFTTLEANLGVFNPSVGSGRGGKIIADIPGLIEGASKGKGLGIKFLKHIEKVGLLLHCITAESEDVVKDYKEIIKELENYNLEILKKKEIILLTKSDLVDKKELEKKIRELSSKGRPASGWKRKVIAVSIHDWDSLENLKRVLSHY